jgi:hypothetical protein
MASEITVLLRKYANILETLKEKGVVQTRNNPVGDYAEWLVAQAFNVEAEPPSTSDYDLMKDGKKYQVKGRRLRQGSPNRQLGIIRNIKDKEPKFDFLAAVFFDDKFDVTAAYTVPHSIVRKHAKFSSYQNGHILNSTAMKAVIADDAVVPLTELLQATQ